MAADADAKKSRSGLSTTGDDVEKMA